jgi:hypothetical protein
VKKRHQARLNAQEKVVNHLSTITINVNIPPTALLQFVPNRGLKNVGLVEAPVWRRRWNRQHGFRGLIFRGSFELH